MMIRSINADDFEDIYALYMDESVNPFMLYDIMDQKDFRKIFNKLLVRDYSWIVEIDGKICGMCFANRGEGRCNHVATLVTLGIKTEYQGQGLGKQLVHKILHDLKRDQIRRVELMAEGDNGRAIAFYKNMGFQIDGTLPCYLKRGNSPDYIDEIVMSLICTEEKAV